MKMFHLSVINSLRRLKTNQQQIVRSIRVAVRTHNGETITKCSRTPEASRGNHCLQQLTGRSFSSFQLLKAQHCFAVRCYTSSSVRAEDGELIYTGTLGRVIRGVKFFSYSSSMFSLCVMPLVLMKTGIGVNSLALQVAFCGIVGFFTFLTPVLLHLVTKGYILRLYHDKETDMYTAITYSALLMEKRTVFHQSDVTIPDISKMFTSFYAKKRSMLVNPMLFPLPHDYNHLMGYDRPFSFDLDDLNKPDKS